MINISELKKLKDEILKLKKDNDERITLEGDSKIILTTSIFDNKDTGVSNSIKNYNGIKENGIDISYLDALIKYYNERYGVYRKSS